MKPSELSRTLKTLLQSNHPVWIWGPPGIGKSSIVKQTAAELDLELIDVRSVTLMSVDVRGIPTVQDGITTWNPPEFLPRTGSGILFLDELGQAETSVQKAWLQLTLDRCVGNYKLPKGWKIVAASNRVTDNAGVRKILEPLRGRFIHLNLETDTEDWLWWAAKNNLLHQVRYFIAFRPSLLSENKPSPVENSGWPAPRAWHILSDTLQLFGEEWPEMVADRRLAELVSGIVGEGASTEFSEFVRIGQQLPSAQEILKQAATFPIPTSKHSLCWALIGSVVDYVSHNESKKLIEQAFILADRLPKEFSILMVKDLHAACKQIAGHPSFVSWATKYYDVFKKVGAL